MPRQLSFDLPATPALGRDDFFVSPANAVALATIESPDRWPAGKLVLSGPQGSGKTHLAYIWAARTGARVVRAAKVANADIPALAAGAVAIEDLPEIAADTAAQTALFHLHNLCLTEGRLLLMTGRGAPHLWVPDLPDLQSRIAGSHHVAIDAPDDALLTAVLAKLFADRQITPRPDVIPYLLRHMDRSFAAAAQIVRRLDHAALAETRTLSRPLAARLLGADGATG